MRRSSAAASSSASRGRVEESVRTRNLKASVKAYLIDPAEHLAVMKRVRAEGRGDPWRLPFAPAVARRARRRRTLPRRTTRSSCTSSCRSPIRRRPMSADIVLSGRNFVPVALVPVGNVPVMTRNGREHPRAAVVPLRGSALYSARRHVALRAGVPPAPQPGPVLNDLVLENATVFTREDVMWLLGLRIGAAAARIAGGHGRLAAPAVRSRGLHRGHRRGRPSTARPAGSRSPCARGASTTSRSSASRRRSPIRSRRAWPAPTSGKAPSTTGARWAARSSGCSRRPRARCAWAARARARATRSSSSSATAGRSSSSRSGASAATSHGRPAPARARICSARWTGSRRAWDFTGRSSIPPAPTTRSSAATSSYKFSSEETGYSFGIERLFLSRPRLFFGAEAHDLTATDDLWRLSTTEQSLVAVGFKNTFRDYYRRRGSRCTPPCAPARSTSWSRRFAGTRTSRSRTKPTSASSATTRRSGRTRRSRPATSTRSCSRTRSTAAGSRVTGSPPGSSAISSTICFAARGGRPTAGGSIGPARLAGHGAGGDYTFDRHILNARAYVPVLPRQSVAARLDHRVLGRHAADRAAASRSAASARSTGTRSRKPPANGWRSSTRSTGSIWPAARATAAAARCGRCSSSTRDESTSRSGVFDAEWLNGIGAGLQAGPFRVEFGYRLNDIPQSRQILVRLGPTF